MQTQASDLIAPDGEIEYAFFPQDTQQQVETRIESWLARGYAFAAAIADAAKREYAATAFAYYRAYNSAYTSLLVTPSQLTANDKGTQVISAEQLRQMRDRMQYWQDQYTLLVPTTVAGEADRAQNVSVRASFSAI